MFVYVYNALKGGTKNRLLTHFNRNHCLQNYVSILFKDVIMWLEYVSNEVKFGLSIIPLLLTVSRVIPTFD